MVDSVGGKPLQLGRVGRTAPVRAVDTPVATRTRAPVAASIPLAKELAASPPVDSDRVARIRRAIAEGKFPLSPATIADRLIALKLEWTGNDQA